MPKIVECIVTTSSPAGEVHIAPIGLISRGEFWEIAPFVPSRTLDNLRSLPFACANHVEDARIFAGCLTGRHDWPVLPTAGTPGFVLRAAVSHWELAVDHLEEDPVRPRFRCRIVRSESHRPFGGQNRALAAVIEGAILVSRLHILPAEQIEEEFARLAIIVGKTAGSDEDEAWGWLNEKIQAWRAARKAQSA